MSFEFHQDSQLYFQNQYKNAKKNILPFVTQTFNITKGARVLEIGCAHGGVLKAFTELGMQAVGVDLNVASIEKARELAKEDIEKGIVSFVSKNIYDVNIETDFKGKFDLIILKDSIEHIHDQRKIIAYLKTFLLPNGKIFFGFPPWYMPFGGHQQICKSKIFGMLPYTHLLPAFLYKFLIKAFGESDNAVTDLLEIKELGISIERFERIVKKENYNIVRRRLYLINPIYEYKFKLKPREQFGLVTAIPFVRNFFTTAVFYLIEDKQK